MTHVFRDQHFSNLRDFGTASTFCDMEFRACRFSWCILSSTLDPRLRSTVQNVRLLKCTFDDQFIGPAIVENVLVEDLSAPQGVQTTGTVFRHVVLRGMFSRLIIGPLYPNVGRPTEAVEPMNSANATFYQDVDWAIDISDARFTDCDIRNIPARLIRRDPTTQAVVRRESVLDDRWKKIDLGKAHWQTSIEWMLERGDSDCVLVAPRRAKNFKHLLKGIELLRAEGIADYE